MKMTENMKKYLNSKSADERLEAMILLTPEEYEAVNEILLKKSENHNHANDIFHYWSFARKSDCKKFAEKFNLTVVEIKKRLDWEITFEESFTRKELHNMYNEFMTENHDWYTPPQPLERLIF